MTAGRHLGIHLTELKREAASESKSRSTRTLSTLHFSVSYGATLKGQFKGSRPP